MSTQGSIVLRIDRNRDYKTISLINVLDAGLSWKATGIHTYLIARPDGWSFNVSDLINRKTDGATAVRSGLQELQQAGYLRIDRIRGEDGRFTKWLWTVSETPMASDNGDHPPDTTKRRTTSGKPTSGETSRGLSKNEKPPHIIIMEHNKRQDNSSSVYSSLRSEHTGQSPNVDKSKSDVVNAGKPVSLPSDASVSDVLHHISGTPKPSGGTLHQRRSHMMTIVQKVAWLKSEPPPNSSRGNEAKILGDLLRGSTENEFSAALHGARAHLGPSLAFSLRLLAAKSKTGQSLFRWFADAYFGRLDGPVPAAVQLAIRAAMLPKAATPEGLIRRQQ